MKLYERIKNNNFDEIDRNRVIELIEGGNGHLVYNENYFKLQEENEELKIKNNAIKRESEAYAKYMIRLDNELNLEKEKSKYEWIRQNCLSQELVNKLYIPIQKIKDKIKEEKMPLTIVGGIRNKKILGYGISLGRMQVLQELLEWEK